MWCAGQLAHMRDTLFQFTSCVNIVDADDMLEMCTDAVVFDDGVEFVLSIGRENGLLQAAGRKFLQDGGNLWVQFTFETPLIVAVDERQTYFFKSILFYIKAQSLIIADYGKLKPGAVVFDGDGR